MDKDKDKDKDKTPYFIDKDVNKRTKFWWYE